MIHFRPGSHVHRLVTILSTTGEFPTRSLYLLGNERVFKAVVHKLTTIQQFRNSRTGAELTCRMLTVSGRGRNKTIRFHRSALPILEWVSAQDYYLHAFRNHKFSGDAYHVERRHRVAEAVAMCMSAGLESRPYVLPKLQGECISKTVPEFPCLYLARELKRVDELGTNKTQFTRLVGAFFSDRECRAVYNTRNAVMKWSGMGEFKARQSITDIARLNAGISRVDSAILFAKSYDTALQTLLESDRSRRMEFRFDAVYRHIHVVTMDENGVRLLQLLSVPDWNEQLLDLLFDPEQRSYNKGQFEYDACIDGVYILSHLDGDIARLIRFRDALRMGAGPSEVLCFPFQVEFLQEFLGQATQFKTIDMSAVEEAIGQERRKLFDG